MMTPKMTPKTQAGFDVSETFPIGQLSKCHTKKLTEAGESFYPVIASVSLYAFVEFVLWQEVH
jgi:hypothetical protein